MSILIRAFLALFAAICVTTPASATTVILGSGGTIGFNALGNLGNTFTSSASPGISLTITANGCGGAICIITSSATGGGSAGFGFGVHNATSPTDGSGLQELGVFPEQLTFRFSAPVTITGFSLEDVDNGINGVVFSRTLPTASTISNIPIISTGAPPGSTYDSVNATYVSQTLSSTGTEFTFSAGGSGQGIRVRSISFVEAPEPATYSMGGIGMCLLMVRLFPRKPSSEILP